MSTSEESDVQRMPFWQHLDELRSRLLHCLGALTLGVILTYNFSERIVLFLEKPLLDILPAGEAHLYFTGIADKFMVYLKVSLLAAVGFTSPYLFYQLWLFVSPGLYRQERRMVLPFVTFATVTFLLGLAFAYTVVVPYGYKFLINFGSPSDKALITLTEYFSLTIKLLLSVGLVFELPVVMVLLAKFGIIGPDLLIRYRKYAFVGSAFVSAVITPSTDAFTMILVMVPLYILYEVGIVGVRLVARKG